MASVLKIGKLNPCMNVQLKNSTRELNNMKQLESKLTGADLSKYAHILGPYCAKHKIGWLPFSHSECQMIFTCEDSETLTELEKLLNGIADK